MIRLRDTVRLTKGQVVDLPISRLRPVTSQVLFEEDAEGEIVGIAAGTTEENPEKFTVGFYISDKIRLDVDVEPSDVKGLC